jgi:transcriptional regulator with XRE-family HTH domain
MPDVVPLTPNAETTGSVRSDLRIGERIRAIRTDQGLTLDETSRRSGVSKSALSKIENDRASPTFEVLERIAAGLGVALVSLFSEQSTAHIGRLTSTPAGQGRRTEDRNYIHEFLCTGLKDRRMVPFVTTVKARSAHQFEKPASHKGEEFLYVLSGEVAFVSGSYAEIRLGAGDSLYFDSRLSHLCYTTSDRDAVLLWVWCETS